MTSTRELLRRAGGRPPLMQQQSAVRPPAPAPARPVCPQPAASPEAEHPHYVAVPQPIHENSIYRQLMRSHDRMATRHLRG